MQVALFITCPVDLLRPSIASASVKLLEAAGYEVVIPAQSCCGQVAYNNGEPKQAKRLAWQLVHDFKHYAYTVVPSGSCAGMIKSHYPSLFDGDPRRTDVSEFCHRVFELSDFLQNIANYQPLEKIEGLANKVVTYHDSCGGLRELQIKQQPRELLQRCTDAKLTEMPNTEECCGFGGTFCVKFPTISNQMVEKKVANAQSVNAELLLGGDLTCLMNIIGKTQRDEVLMEARHFAEVLANQLDTPPIGVGEEPQP